MASLTINYTVPFGASARIGYRIVASGGAYTYLNNFPSYNQSPYTINDIPFGSYEVEITTVCATCSGGVYSDPVVITAQAMS